MANRPQQLELPPPRTYTRTEFTALRASVSKYRDPKSGATWSGKGRAPAWIAEVKNRNRFLIKE